MANDAATIHGKIHAKKNLACERRFGAKVYREDVSEGLLSKSNEYPSFSDSLNIVNVVRNREAVS